jgi:hypothetical protein
MLFMHGVADIALPVQHYPRDGHLKPLLEAVTGATPDPARAGWLSGFWTLPSP